MLIIFFGLPLRPYVDLYPWVDTNWVPINIVGSERKVPKERFRLNLFDFEFTDQLYFTRLN
jgi:hypothetical protein